MPFQIIRNDITKVSADAIVNTANPDPVYASGTDAAVYHAAGADSLLAERKKIGKMKPGEVNVTEAYGLDAKYIIHTVGPAWIDGKHGEFDTLASCYRKSLHLAEKLGCESIAFPLIATGVYGFPKDKALNVALHEIREFLESAEMEVTLVVFSREAYELSADLAESVRQFIDDNYCSEINDAEYGHPDPFGTEEQDADVYRREQNFIRNRWLYPTGSSFSKSNAHVLQSSTPVREKGKPEPEKSKPTSAAKKKPKKVSIWKDSESGTKDTATATGHVFGDSGAGTTEKTLEALIEQAGESFPEMLQRKMLEKKMTAPQVYNRANIDKKLFSKIKNNPNHVPKKQTAVALAIALRLNLDETVDLIGRAGLALSPSSKFDLIITYCIEHKIYDRFKINALLFDYDQPLLGNEDTP